MDWDPTTPSAWLAKHPDLDGDRVFAVLAGDNDGPCTEADRREILDACAKDLIDQHWQKASKHYLGGGLQHGSPSFEPARRAHKELTKSGEYLQASMLDKVVA